MVVERLLHGMQLPVRGETLDRGDLGAVGLDAEDGAGLHGDAVEQHGAGAARGRVATDARPREREALAQDVDQQVARLDLELVPRSVDGQGNRTQREPPSSELSRAYSSARPAAQATAYRSRVMIEIREIGEDELAAGSRSQRAAVQTAPGQRRRLSSTGSGRPRTWPGSSPPRTTRTSRVGFAYVGWHSEPGTGTRRGAGPARRIAAPASAPPCSQHSRTGSPTRGCVVLETSVREDDEESLAWADRRGFREVEPQLAARARPDRDRGAGDRSPRRGRDRDRGPSDRIWCTRIYAVACEAYPDVPGSEDAADRRVRGLALEGHAGSQRLPGGDVRRVRRRRGRRVREAVRLELDGGRRAPRHDRRPAGVRVGGGSRARSSGPRSRGRSEHGLHAARDVERGAQRADPPAQRALRLRRQPGEVVLRAALAGPD